MFLISAQKRSNRLQICKTCEHFLPHTKSCGTIGIGSKVDAPDGSKVKLCGCIMTVKTRLKIASCPLKKWTSEISKSNLEKIKSLLDDIDGLNTITGAQNKKLTELWNIAAGGNKTVSSCNSCVRQTIKDLKKLIKDE